MATILHVAHRQDWDDAQSSGVYRVSTRGATLSDVGFIHASFPGQIAAMAEAFYADDPAELVVLVLESNEIEAAGVRVVVEDGGAGEGFPHIYGAIRSSSVREARPAGFTDDGRFHY